MAVSIVARQQPRPSNADLAVQAAIVGVTGCLVGFLAGAAIDALLRILDRGHDADDRVVESPLEQRRLRGLLRGLVSTCWVDSELERSLARQARLELGFAERPGAVDNPLRVVIRRPDEPDRPLPRGTPIGTAFHQLHDQVLILGAPGAGKTTLLLELTNRLLEETRHIDADRVPVVFHLSSWTARSGTIADWLVSELKRRYDVPPRLGRRWVTTDLIIPLLDGLDEVRAEHRDACVGALNPSGPITASFRSSSAAARRSTRSCDRG